MTIGVLLPRSTDYPAMAFDLLDGLKLSLKNYEVDDVLVVTENIGFGEDKKSIYAKAEKLLMQDDADYVIGYLSPANAEMLYPLLEAAGRMLIVVDAGMTYPTAAPSNNAVHISFQGMHAALLTGKKAGENSAEVIMATSFYDGGYRGPWLYSKGVSAAGGKVVDNYVSHYKVSEFTTNRFAEAVRNNATARIGACFSTYLSTLFLNALTADASLPPLEMYCSSYMLEEQNISNYTLPKGKFYGYIPWASNLDNHKNTRFINEVYACKNKKANIFHLMGWEAGIVLSQLVRSGSVLKQVWANLSYISPRGEVTIHPGTHTSYAPLYYAEMVQADDGPSLVILDDVGIDAREHFNLLNDRPEGITSGWVNHYLCS